MKKIVALVLMLFLIAAPLVGCRESEKVSYNVSQEADNFNVIRRIVVYNARSDTLVFELTAAFSFTLEDNRIVLICETGPNQYKKHSIGINGEYTLWFIEDVSGANVDKYKYEVNFLPEMIVPFTITSND